uniref:Uncharacterized protein n=1 Tax=Chenopodium quinoa TaxID=63459 RepID=A0A803MZ04_CHEQI
MQDVMGRWYCCNDSYVTLSTLQEALSEKAYILFFTRNGHRPVAVDNITVLNGVKPNGINGSNMPKSPRSSIAAKAMNMKLSNAPSLVKGIPLASKNVDASAILQNKFSGLTNSLAKRVLMNGNNVHSMQNNNGNCRNGEQNAVASSQVLINGDTHLKNGNLGPVKGSLSEDNGLKNKEFAGKVIDNGVIHNGQRNERSDFSGPRKLENAESAGKKLDNGALHIGHSYKCIDFPGSKRNLEDRDSCILLAKDAKSRAKVEEFKELLQKEAALALQTSGWSDKVYEYMRSKKRACVDACSSTDNKEP